MSGDNKISLATLAANIILISLIMYARSVDMMGQSMGIRLLLVILAADLIGLAYTIYRTK